MKRATLLTLCLLLALPAAPALAKKKHKKKPVKLGPVVTVTATGNTATDPAETTATATCPAGKQAVGGGFTAPLVPGSAVIVHDSYRSAPNAWTVAGQVANGSGAVTAVGYCRNPSPSVTDVTATATLNTNAENKTLAPSCPSGLRLIGGGFQSSLPATPGDSIVFPQVNQATSASTWTVTGVDSQGGDTLTLTAHAYCMPKIAAPRILNASTSGLPDEFAQIAVTTPSCPAPAKPKKKGKKKKKKKPAQLLSAGGFSSTLYNGTNSAMVFGDSRADASGGWRASAVNGTGDTTPVSLTSQGICF